MKTIFAAVLLSLALACSALSQTISDVKSEFEKATVERGQLHEEFNITEKKNAEFKAQKKDLDFDRELFERDKAPHNALAADHATRLTALTTAIADHNQAVSSYTQQTAAHNANQCHYHDGHPEECNWYVQEGYRLLNWQTQLNNEDGSLRKYSGDMDAEAARINQSKADLDSRWAAIKERCDEFDARLAIFNAQVDKHNAAWHANEDRFARILRTMASIGVQTNACKEALKDTRDGALENIHAVCGAMFDGNRP